MIKNLYIFCYFCKIYYLNLIFITYYQFLFKRWIISIPNRLLINYYIELLNRTVFFGKIRYNVEEHTEVGRTRSSLRFSLDNTALFCGIWPTFQFVYGEWNWNCISQKFVYKCHANSRIRTLTFCYVCLASSQATYLEGCQ